MSLTAGTRLGPYEIACALGAGGMGEVYRARDTRLGRDVAVKILPELFLTDPERVARFEREAQLLAALNHPHVAQIYGLDRQVGRDGRETLALVMEFVDGESLAQRLEGAKGSGLGCRESLGLAAQIVDALGTAHEKGIIHRDLKPANVMLTADGQVKVLDFGLAKALESGASHGSAGPGGLTHSPTLTFAATQAGMILGTAAYMSPEQARGRAADKRSDIWAFGCVLFEMLSGRRAFEGEDAKEVIAAVVRGEPDWGALPDDLPVYIRTLIKRCLEKDRKARIADMSVARYVMTDVAPGSGSGAPATRGQKVVPIVLGAAGVLIGAVGVAMWLGSHHSPEPKRTSRFTITPPANHHLGGVASDRNVLISEDGTHIVYPAWARDGRELFYLDRNNFMTVVKVLSSSTSLATSSPVKALEAATAITIGVPYRNFDVSPDGKRFLVIKEARDPDTKSAATPGLVVVQNWVEELKARLPAK